MDESKLMEQLRCFVDLQISLVAAFSRAFPEISDREFMVDASKQGCVDTGRELWLFKKHGGGLAFKNWDGVTIDVHSQFTSPDLFDAWRVMQYVESINRLDSDEREDNRDFEQVDHRQMESWLSQLATTGKLVRCSSHSFRLA